MIESGLEPTTGLEKPALLCTMLNTIIGIQNMKEKITKFKQQLFQKDHMIFFFKFSPDNLLIVLYKLIKVSSRYL